MITLREQGSGGSNVGAHILSPYTRGLLQHAIIEDRGFLVLGEQRLELVEASAKIVLDRIRCSDPETRLQCVQDIDPKDIISAQPKRFSAIAPIIDTNYLSLADFVGAVNGANNVNLLLGFSPDSTSDFLALRVLKIYAKTASTYDDTLKTLGLFVEFNQVKKIAGIFIGDPNKPISIRKIQDGLVRFLNEIIHVPCFQYYAAPATAKAESLTKCVYTYEYNHVPLSNDYQFYDVQRELGVCYRAAQSSIFGQPYSNYWYHTDEDRKMSEIMMDIYTSFMRTGKPQLPNGKEWPNWNDPKSEDPIIATAVLDAKNGGIIDRCNPQFCLDNFDLVNNSLITKLYPLDEYDVDTQRKVDKNPDYTDFLHNAIQAISYVDY
ncbi:acetylcholinesterase-like [Brevipalpus obovatus]|uniref:acetylcholinesterase-like n=1 Tax=Brevipalpus obovatus TaxID=246614 RepID=UPI003D9DFB7C